MTLTVDRIALAGAAGCAAIGLFMGATGGSASETCRAIPLHDVVKIDLHVPGCPPSAPTILFVITELLEGRIPDLRSKVRFG